MAKEWSRNDDGIIHDHVYFSEAHDSIGVIAGKDAADKVFVIVSMGPGHTSFAIPADKAREVGRLLIAAADQTDSLAETCGEQGATSGGPRFCSLPKGHADHHLLTAETESVRQ